ncbi:MAG: hypothetical protein HDT30_05760 [Clostridiales bacterium]|nr:hypothetical protein [Clostridiales bacterium]
MRKTGIIVAVGIVLLLGLVYMIFRESPEVKNGIYKIENNEEYSEAYIEVKDGYAQFFNIDLNAIYKEKISERYIIYLTRQKQQNLSETEMQEIREAIDLNTMFCDKPFPITNSDVSMQDDEESYLYYYSFGCVVGNEYFLYTYNAKEKNIILSTDTMGEIIFSRK